MSEEEDDYDDDTWQPTAKDELTAIKDTLKRMEKRQNDFWKFLVYGSITLVFLYSFFN